MRQRQRAFTLIELLVVIVILSCLVGLVSFSVGNNHPRELQAEAQRIAAVIALLADEAVLDSSEYGLLLDAEGYSVQRYAEECLCWVEPPGERIHHLPSWAELEFELEGEPLQISKAQSEEEGAQSTEPQLLLLSSGELSEFRLLLKQRDGLGPVYELQSDGFQLPRVGQVEN